MTTRLTTACCAWTPAKRGGFYVYLSANDVKEAVGQFSRYGVLGPGELSGSGDEPIYAVQFECNLAAMLEKMLEAGFTDLPRRSPGGCSPSSSAANGLARNCLNPR
jgi:hypothetical protein